MLPFLVVTDFFRSWQAYAISSAQLTCEPVLSHYSRDPGMKVMQLELPLECYFNKNAKNYRHQQSSSQVNIVIILLMSFLETMAELLPEETTLVECGFCYSNNENLQDPRSLPCSHVHCHDCLTSFYETHNVVQCPLQSCRLVALLTCLGFTKHKK